MIKSSQKVALGGICSSLAVVILLLSSVMPMMEYAIPALAGMMLVPLVIEMGIGPSLTAWLASSVLGLLICTNREAAVLYASFFGLYPIIKAWTEHWNKKLLEWFVKMASFNVCILAGYGVLVYILGMQDLVSNFQTKFFGPVVFLLIGNAVFVLYDFAMTKMITLYLYRIRPHIHLK